MAALPLDSAARLVLVREASRSLAARAAAAPGMPRRCGAGVLGGSDGADDGDGAAAADTMTMPGMRCCCAAAAADRLPPVEEG